MNQILLVAASAALLTAVVISTFVTRRLVRPIQRMKVASERIASGEYEERVDVSGEDELGALAQSFNRMAQTLAETEERRRQLIGDVAHELRPQYREKEVDLELQLPSPLPTVSADKWRMTQVMTNLLGNALQYTPKGGRVTVTAGREKEVLVVRVADTGIGITPSTCRTFSSASTAWINRARAPAAAAESG